MTFEEIKTEAVILSPEAKAELACLLRDDPEFAALYGAVQPPITASSEHLNGSSTQSSGEYVNPWRNRTWLPEFEKMRESGPADSKPGYRDITDLISDDRDGY